MQQICAMTNVQMTVANMLKDCLPPLFQIFLVDPSFSQLAHGDAMVLVQMAPQANEFLILLLTVRHLTSHP